jgi:hypothetical protein
MAFTRGSLKTAIGVCYDRSKAEPGEQFHIVNIPAGKYYVVEDDATFRKRLSKPGLPNWRHVYGGVFMELYQLTHNDQLHIFGGSDHANN